MSDSPRHFGSDHRLAIGALAILAVAILALSILQFQRAVRAPFERRGPKYKTVAEREVEAREAQKTADTDRDGLSDYDELYLYQTSPYLDDTDSDGYRDGVEVQTGNDPNCPAGSECGGGAATEPARSIIPSLAPPTPSEFIGPESLLQGFNAATVRTLLRSSGVPDDVLNNVDDKALEELYLQALSQAVPGLPGVATSTE